MNRAQQSLCPASMKPRNTFMATPTLSSAAQAQIHAIAKTDGMTTNPLENAIKTTASTTTGEDRRAALHWLLTNRRDDVSFESAIQTLRAALRGDQQAQYLPGELASHERKPHA
jgi:hypothetical protein